MPDPVRITEREHRSVVGLRSWARCSDSAEGASVLATVGAEARLLDLGPGEWWMVSDTLSGAALCERGRRNLEGRTMAIVDLSCGLKVLRVAGVAAREVLAKGCGLDFHPQRFPVGFVTRTRFAQLPVAIHCIDPVPSFELYVARSCLAWIRSWLDDAAVEFLHNAPMQAHAVVQRALDSGS